MKNPMLRDVAAVFVILFLLPYVVTILAFGFPEKNSSRSNSAEQSVYISYDGRQEKITVTQYLTGVLAAQIPVDYQMEALKAHAVLARTYFQLHVGKDTVIEKDTAAQTFLTKEQMKNLWGDKFEENYKKLEQAVTDTGDECLYADDRLAEPYFHAASAGKTRDGTEVFGEASYAYLAGCDCKKDLQADNYVTIRSFTEEEIEEYLVQLSEKSGIQQETVQTEESTQEGVSKESSSALIDSFQVLNRDSCGYVTRIQVQGRTVHGETFRNVFGLPSAAFQIEEWESGLRFVCKGLGHGLGMSLYSANEMAKEGDTHREILQYFFKNISIKK